MMADMVQDKSDKHDPGGKRSFSLPLDVHGSAKFGGKDDCYRYVAEYCLSNWVGRPRMPTLMAVGMNPSTADHHTFDPTIAKIWKLSLSMGFVRILMTNTYAYRATDQGRLLEISDPIGPKNDEHLLNCARLSDMILACYGTPRHKGLQKRGMEVVQMLCDAGHSDKLHVLKLSKSGIPYHPLYLPDTLRPFRWNERSNVWMAGE
jgi:hypothetical protein